MPVAVPDGGGLDDPDLHLVLEEELLFLEYFALALLGGRQVVDAIIDLNLLIEGPMFLGEAPKLGIFGTQLGKHCGLR